MSKEYLEALETLKDMLIGNGVNDNINDYVDNLILPIKQALHRLEAIDNANPSEALEHFINYCENHTTGYTNDTDREDMEYVQQALLKAEKEHNSINLLMRELDCKDMETLRKYARCGYEKLNNFKGSKEVKIEIPESSLMDYNPAKHYLKWEDLEFKEMYKIIPVRMGDNVYQMAYCLYENEGYIRLEDCQRIYLELFANEKKFFNDLHLERVEE